MSTPEPVRSDHHHSPAWNATTKIIVVVFTLLLIGLLVWRFQSLIGMIVLAAILAYLLDPLISFINKRTTIQRGFIIAAVYLLLAAAIIGGFFALGVASFQQITNLINLAPNLILDITELVQEFVTRSDPFEFGPFEINPSQVPWERITEQLLGFTDPLLSQGGTIVSRFATTTVRTAFNIIFVFVLSIYLAIDLPRFGDYFKRFAQLPGYRKMLSDCCRNCEECGAPICAVKSSWLWLYSSWFG
jgi:predicted PurR-regulated permease PerM